MISAAASTRKFTFLQYRKVAIVGISGKIQRRFPLLSVRRYDDNVKAMPNVLIARMKAKKPLARTSTVVSRNCRYRASVPMPIAVLAYKETSVKTIAVKALICVSRALSLSFLQSSHDET